MIRRLHKITATCIAAMPPDMHGLLRVLCNSILWLQPVSWPLRNRSPSSHLQTLSQEALADKQASKSRQRMWKMCV